MKRFKVEKDLKQYKQIKIKDFTKFVKNISIYKFWTFTVILEKVGLLLLI